MQTMLSHWRVRLFIAFLAAIPCFTIACKNSAKPPVETPSIGWTSLGLNSKLICQVVLKGDTLYALLRDEGIAYQSPPFTGPWKTIPPPLSRLGENFQVASYVVRSDEIVAGMWTLRGQDPTERLHRFNFAQARWSPIDMDGKIGSVWDVHETSGGSLVVTTANHLLLRYNPSEPQWVNVWDQYLASAQIESSGELVVIGGANGFRTPVMLWSEDDGRSLVRERIDVQIDFHGDADVESMSFGPDELWVVLASRLFVRPKTGGDFVEKLSTYNRSMLVVANPEIAGLVVCVADSVYVSKDSGDSWTAISGPDGEDAILRRSKTSKSAFVDWENERIFLARRADDEQYELVCLQLKPASF